ncbi:MAG: AI-2E family transporter [Bacillota bacterium]|nr:AI-2E family transporter [Bacillota bacterium]
MVTIYKKIIYCILLLCFLLLTVFVFVNYLKPFFAAAGLTILSTPIYEFMHRKKLFHKKICAVISLALINLTALICIFYIGNFFIESLSLVVNDLNLGDNANKISFNLSSLTNINFLELFNNINLNYNKIVNTEILKKGAVYTTDGIFAYFVGNITAYFILIDKYVILNYVENFISKDKMNLISSKLQTIRNLVQIEVILVIVTTIVTIIGLCILGVKNSLVIGILCGILDILPFVGTILVFIPLIFYEWYTKQYIIAIGLVCLYILLQFNRQILETKFISNKLNIHPLLIIFSVYIGAKIFGIIGLFLGPLYAITVKEIIFA